MFRAFSFELILKKRLIGWSGVLSITAYSFSTLIEVLSSGSPLYIQMHHLVCVITVFPLPSLKFLEGLDKDVSLAPIFLFYARKCLPYVLIRHQILKVY